VGANRETFDGKMMTMTIAGKDHSGYYVGRGNKKIKKPTPRYLPVDFIKN